MAVQENTKISGAAPTTKPTQFPRSRRVIALAVMSAALSACSVKPERLTDAEQRARVADDLNILFSQQEPITGPLTLEEAMARAIKYNLDNRLKAMEVALTARQLDVANFDLLPNLVAQGGYEGRNNVPASSSRSVRTGQQSLEPSQSQDRDRRVFDITLTWNILDFGVSYVRAKQAADRQLILEERKRKVVHNIMQDVRSSYWAALSAQRLLRRLDPLTEQVATALASAREIEQRRLQPPVEALTYRRGLLDAMRQVQALRRELLASKTQLAALIGSRPGQDFTLADSDELYREPAVRITLDEVERLALLNRPELAEEAYQTRIGSLEVKRAMLSMLPGINLDIGHNYDSNSYLVNNNWLDYGAKVIGNLFTMFFNGPSQIKAAEAAKEVAHTRRLALSMAVISQAHISWITYRQAIADYRTAKELYEVEGAILRENRAAGATGRSNDLERINSEITAVLAELRRDFAAAEMNNAAGRLFVTAGVDPLPATVSSIDTKSLAAAIRENMQGWETGATIPRLELLFPSDAADPKNATTTRDLISQADKHALTPGATALR
jgi:multidrug efflux system outer membrane protein